MPPEPPSVPMRLDLANERLWCGDQARALRPKTFALLRYLVAHPDQLLPKAALLEALWPQTMVSEVVLSVCIRELRQALGDDPKTPRFIETVHRRGYRFIGHLPTGHPAAPRPVSPAPPPLLAGREREWGALHRSLATALTGVRQLVFITGEAGLGKTTLVDAFLTAIEGEDALWIGRGQCLDHYGTGEAYLPLLEAMERLCRGPGGQEVVALLAQQAPTWVVQMPGLLSPADQERVQRRLVEVTQERMLRELAEALTVLTAARPLVLVLEDLHWSDAATLDVVAALARRRELARLLLLGTYRPPDALQRGHPLPTVHHELQRHGQCVELPLPGLPEAAMAAYLATRFPDAPLPAGLARLVQQRTEGHPLFMVTVVEEWVRQGWLVQDDGARTLRVGLAALAGTIPESLRLMLEQHLEHLSPLDQQVLEAGSVAGATFSAAAVAAGLGHEVVQVEAWCASLVRRRQWLEACGEQVWPDGTVSEGYRFTHALYHEVAYHRLPAARRAQLHRRIGAREAVGYGPQGRERAAVLAMHFVRGRDAQRAVPYLRLAGDTALQRSAYVEAIAHLTQGLEVLRTLPETPERAQQELDFHIALGPALMATQGQTAPEVERLYTRARALCERVGEPAQLFRVLWGLRVVSMQRGAWQPIQGLEEDLLRLAQRLQNPDLLLEAHHALGSSRFFCGELTAARPHLERGMRLYAPQRHRAHAALYSGHDPGVCCHMTVAHALWLLGYPDQAVVRIEAALALAQQLAHPFSLTLALDTAAVLHHLRREAPQTQARAEAALTLATDQAFPQLVAQATLLRGWALATGGHGEEGRTQLQQGLAAYHATGATANRPYYLALLAETSAQVGQTAAGLEALAEALTTLATSRVRWYEAELYRLTGALLLQRAVTPPGEVEACFQQALTVARRQQAKSLELRAAMSLARLWQQQGKRAEAYELLAPLSGWFTEGFDTADLQEAQALLEELGG